MQISKSCNIASYRKWFFLHLSEDFLDAEKEIYSASYRLEVLLILKDVPAYTEYSPEIIGKL